MTLHIYILTEGVVDLTFLSRVLVETYGLSRVQYADELGEWERFQRTFSWPRQSPAGRSIIGDFSIAAPEYLRALSGEPLLVLLRQANGDEMWKILRMDLEFLLWRTDEPAVDAIGIFVDADVDPVRQQARIRSKLEELKLATPADTYGFGDGLPRVGIFLFPGDSNPGTIEANLLALGETVYPRLRSKSLKFVDEISNEDFPTPRDRTEFGKRAGRSKAVIGAMTALLRPGHATPRTLRSDRWLDREVVARTHEMEPCIGFLSRLLGRSPSDR
jgi:hypothetical protein